MNSNIAFASEDAEMINELLQKQVASHLFLSCNYNPESIFRPINNDALFIQAVLNLYNFYIDCGISRQLIPIGKNHGYDLKKLKDIIDVINAIRQTLGHNNSELSANDKEQKRVHQWCLEVLGKKFENTHEDYGKVLDIIKSYGDTSIIILSKFINHIGQLLEPEKNDVIKEWEEKIIAFYKRSNSKNILEGQIKMYFESEVGYNRQKDNINIATMTKEMLTHENEIQNCEERKQKLLDLKSNDKMTEEMVKEIDEAIEKTAKQIELLTKDGCKNSCEIEKFRSKKARYKNMTDVYVCYNYYLEDVLPKSIEEKIKNNKQHVSLLPQSIVQVIIIEDFKNVLINAKF